MGYRDQSRQKEMRYSSGFLELRNRSVLRYSPLYCWRKSYEHTAKATSHTLSMTKDGVGSVASKAGAAAAPYVDRVMANEQVSKVVGNVVDASVGVGSMVTTVHATAKEKVI